MPSVVSFTDAVSTKLVLEHVSKWFRTSSLHVQALDDVTLRIAEGEFVCLVGPSGCGKSTLLNIIAGLERPDHGVVQADGQAIIGPGPHRLMMFQEAALFPWLTVLGNVLFGLKLTPGLSSAERRERAEYFLELVGLTRFMQTLLFEIHPADPLTFISIAVVLALVALAAGYLPARRAARIDPVESLRQ